MYQLTEHEAFLAVSQFLELYTGRVGDDMSTLLTDLTIDPHGQTFDLVAWDDWLTCIASVKADPTSADRLRM